MTREEIIAGLKAGKTLMMDGAATDIERELVGTLQETGLVEVNYVQGEQYGAYRIRWKTTLPGGERT